MTTDVSACLVTRGDVPLTAAIATIHAAGINDVVVWNNATAPVDLAVYGRYAAIERAVHPVIYTQDDDAIVDTASIRALIDAYEPGVAACNVPERFRGTYHDSALVGFGAIFDRHLPTVAFLRFLSSTAIGVCPPDVFHRRCDNVFTVLTPLSLHDVRYTDQPWASAPGRMWTTAGHSAERDRVLELARLVRDAAGPDLAGRGRAR